MLTDIKNGIERHFLLIALFFSYTALFHPGLFTGSKGYIAYLLGIIMFGMGLSLQTSDFGNVFKHFKRVLVGVFCQYTIMPLLAFVLVKLFQLPLEIALGFVLLGSCPGGTASNVMAYLARANVALSVTMTLVSTLLAPLLTPGLVYLLMGENIQVPFLGMMIKILWIVILPIVAGVVIRRYLYRWCRNYIEFFPSVSILTISYIIAIVVALNEKTILTLPWVVFVVVLLHNLLGLTAGYSVGRILRYPESDCRTLALEVGMQNSGLGVSLATQFYSALTALPSALFSLWHNLSGIILASYWRCLHENRQPSQYNSGSVLKHSTRNDPPRRIQS